MARSLAGRAAEAGLADVATEVADLTGFDLAPASADLIVTNYALHHLVDAQKRALVARSMQWLRPGGRLVIADMMFGRGAQPAGPPDPAPEGSRAGRQGTRRMVADREKPGPLRPRRGPGAPGHAGVLAGGLRDAGFTDVEFQPVVAEAGIVRGIRPASA